MNSEEDCANMLTPQELAGRLSMSLKWVRVHARRCPGFRKVGHAIRFVRSEVVKGMLRESFLLPTR